MNDFKAIFNALVNSEIYDLLAVFGIFFGFFLLKRFIVKYVYRAIKRFVKKTKNNIDDNLENAVQTPLKFFMIILGVYFSLRYLGVKLFNKELLYISFRLLKVSQVVVITWIIYNLTLENSVLYEGIQKRYNVKVNRIVFPFISIIIRIVVFVISISIIAKEFGFTGFITGLGISGLAFALAAQDTFSNLIGGMVIVLDKPFSIGDWIQTTEIEGIVEDITFRSTRIRTFAKALVTVPNSKLANANIINWTQREERRIHFILSISHDTKRENLQRVINGIEYMLETHEKVNKELIIVSFNEFKSSSLDIFIYFYIRVNEYRPYMKVKEEINFRIMDILENEGVKLAKPCNSIYFNTPLKIVEPLELKDFKE
ncbi:putative MscS family protein YhdY [Clostridium polyendosporum]|uniref:MscS family protein YhdY n=1 Tax=Clostridium polyendosporum TaxID=69208 RepID=A0A919VFV7_9CLOT|nr:mechanosensitive ion channel family protein [Clostridium polyendosporum]GIM30719.1 putative MscS family protein YhdY [Clostridium polyendosporum]